MSAFVGMIVIIGSWFVGSLGVLAGAISFATAGTRWRQGALGALCLNAGLLAFSVLVNFM